MANKRTMARRAALQAVYQWQIAGHSPAEIGAQFDEDERLAKVDRELFDNLVREVTTRADELDQLLSQYIDRAVDQLDPVERAVLRLGAFELQCHPEVPWRVVINEAVELARGFGAEKSHRYVNAVLDRLARQLRATEIETG